MVKNYESPQIEVIEIEMEGTLCASAIEVSAPGVTDDGDAW